MPQTPGHKGRVRVGLAQASPSLALVKYWGKSDSAANLPATPSLAVSLGDLVSETRVFAVEEGQRDIMLVDNEPQEESRFSSFFEGLRDVYGRHWFFWAESRNNFPAGSGLASSSSGFAALAVAAAAAVGAEPGPSELSALARRGSGSAARAIYGGFTQLPAGAERAEQLHGHDHWPDLRILVAVIKDGPKELSSRGAMEQTRLTSPYYRAWVADAPGIYAQAKKALAARDLAGLGRLMRQSYLRMFATMFGADPPIIYWHPRSLSVIRACEELRAGGVQAWETMDAGPQVKVLCLEAELGQVRSALEALDIKLLVTGVGPGPRVIEAPQVLGPPHRLIAGKAEALGLSL